MAKSIPQRYTANPFRIIGWVVAMLFVLQVGKWGLKWAGGAITGYLSMLLMAVQQLLIYWVVCWFIIRAIFIRRLNLRMVFFLSWGLLLLAIAAIEILFNSWLQHPDRIPSGWRQGLAYYYNQYDRDIIQYDSAVSKYDSALFYTFKPDKTYAFRNREFDTRVLTNHAGLRDSDSALAAPEIVYLGDSYMMGWGLEAEQTIGRQISLLSGLNGLNASMSSYGTAREMKRLGKLNLQQVRYIVLQYCGNDAFENEAYLGAGHRLSISPAAIYQRTCASYRWLRRYFPGKLFFQISAFYLKLWINRVYPVFGIDDIHGVPTGPSDAAVNFLSILDDYAGTWSGARMLVFYGDNYPSLGYGSAFIEACRKLVAAHSKFAHLAPNLQFVDVSSKLSPDDYYLLDLHYRPTGATKVAKAIVASLPEHP